MKQIAIRKDVYEQLKELKHDDEDFSTVILRLILICMKYKDIIELNKKIKEFTNEFELLEKMVFDYKKI